MGLLDAFYGDGSTPPNPDATLPQLLNSPMAQGLLGAVATYAANARRGAPLNSLGAGLAGGLSAYTNAGQQDLRRKYVNAQTASMDQESQLRALQLEQQKQEWALQQPLLQGLVGRLGGGGAQPADPTTSQPAIPPMQGGGLGSGTFGMSLGGQSASAPTATMGGPGASSGGIIPGVPDDVTRWTVATGGLKGIPGLMTEYNKPTDVQKMLAAANIDPKSSLGQQYVQAWLAKQNYIAPVNARPGSILRDPNTNKPVAFNPHIPDGSAPMFDASGNVTSIVPINNAYPAMANARAATEWGSAETSTSVSYDAAGTPHYSTKAQDLRRAGAVPPGQAPSTAPSASVPLDASKGQYAILTQERAKAVASGNTSDVQSIDREISRLPAAARVGGGSDGLSAPPATGLTPVPKLGTATGQENAQNEVSKRWQTLVTQNQEAQNTKSYLDSIKGLAGKAATGPFTDKLQFTNALLSLVGNEKATDATTANALLDKYSNQIVSRLGGSGGLATDSARSILQSAYPNAHMTKEAILEAADNISGAQSMVQAKTELLTKHANARDPSAYSKAEVQFDQNADPRLWQLKNMDQASAQKWLAAQPPSVQADLRRRAGNLKMLGVL